MPRADTASSAILASVSAVSRSQSTRSRLSWAQSHGRFDNEVAFLLVLPLLRFADFNWFHRGFHTLVSFAVLCPLSTSDIGHGGCHDRDELHVCVEGQPGHEYDGVGHVLHVHPRFGTPGRRLAGVYPPSCAASFPWPRCRCRSVRRRCCTSVRQARWNG